MTASLGVELGPGLVRAVRLDGWRSTRTRVVESAWDPDGPAAAVGELRAQLGRAPRVAVSVRMPLLFAKRVKLPPLPPAERRNVLRLEPQRYFPVRLEDLVVSVRGDDLVFAAREAALADWVKALEDLGPVDLVEPGPLALARALGRAGIADATALLDDRERGVAIVGIAKGAVTSVRRPWGPPAEALAPLREAAPQGCRMYLWPWDEDRARELGAAVPDCALQPVPELPGVPAAFLGAYGAALGVGRDLDDALLPDELRGRIVARRRRGVAIAAFAAVAAAVFAVASLDGWRARAVERTAAQVRALQETAAPALALQAELNALRQRADAIAAIQADRPDPLGVLLALTRRLPDGASLRSLRFSGGEWQLDGYAKQAGEVTQALARAPEFREVRLTSATNRADVGGQVYETFAIAFRFVPPS